MWTVDVQCSRCAKKEECKDRPKIITTLSQLSNTLNTEQEFIDSPGDGIIIAACRDLAVA